MLLVSRNIPELAPSPFKQRRSKKGHYLLPAQFHSSRETPSRIRFSQQAKALKSHRAPKGKEKVFQPSFFRGKLAVHFRGGHYGITPLPKFCQKNSKGSSKIDCKEGPEQSSITKKMPLQMSSNHSRNLGLCEAHAPSQCHLPGSKATDDGGS